MPNDDKPEDKETRPLNVRIRKEIFDLFNVVASATGQTQAELLEPILEKRLKTHKKRMEQIAEDEKRISGYDWKA